MPTRPVTMIRFAAIACAAVLADGARAQCVLLAKESFRLGERPHGNNGRLRDAQIHSVLRDYWAQAPTGAMWIATDVAGVPTWGFAASSLDPVEVDPLDQYNGTAFGDAGAAALLPLTRPAIPFTLSADVVMGFGTTSEARLGYTSSLSLLNNLATGGSLWMTLNGKGEWSIRVNGSTVVTSGTEPLWGEFGGAWLRMELTFDPAAATVSGRVMNHTIPPTPVPTPAPSSHLAIEASQGWVVVNNLALTAGPALATVASGDSAVCAGGVVVLSAVTNAEAPAVLGWSQDWRLLADGPQADGSVVSGATTGTLVISNASPLIAGAYRAHAANACGSAISTPHPIAFGGAGCACPCPADFDASGGTPDAGDIDAYFAAWLDGQASADADCSGGTPDAGDIDTFFAAWLAGVC